MCKGREERRHHKRLWCFRQRARNWRTISFFPPQFIFVSLHARTSLLQHGRGSRNPQNNSFCLVSSPSWPPFPRATGSVSPIPQITGIRRGVLGVLCGMLPACWGTWESQAGLAALMRNPQTICRGCMHLWFGVYIKGFICQENGNP